MTAQPIDHWLNLDKMSTGSCLFCLNDIQGKVKKLKNKKLSALVDTAITDCKAARDLEFDWTKQQDQVTTGRGKAFGIDNQIDRVLSGITGVLDTVAALPGNPKASKMATDLQHAIFPNGVRPFTALKFEDEYAAVTVLLNRLNKDYATQVKTLGLTLMVDELTRLHTEFGGEIRVENDQQVTFDQVSAARAKANTSFDRVVAVILGDYVDDDANRGDLMQAVRDQQMRTARHFKRYGTAPQVDPTTGQELSPSAPKTQPADAKPASTAPTTQPADA